MVLHCLAVGESAVPALGMQSIPDQLAARLPADTVHLATPVASVAPGEVRTADGRVVRATAVVVATEGPAAAALLRERHVDDPGSRATWAARGFDPRQPRSPSG